MKFSLPGAVWQNLQPLIDRYRHLIIPQVDKDFALLFKHNDPESGFYFQCAKVQDNGHYRIELKPTSTQSNHVTIQDVDAENLFRWLKQWFEALEVYDKLETVYDDPILKRYQDEFVTYFSLQDDDADQVPFDFERQLKLDQYLANIKGLLENRKESATEEEKKELADIDAEVDSLKKDMTSLTKNQTVARLSKILAKSRKFGMDLIKEFFGELKKEAFKMIAKATLTGDLPSMDTIMGYIN